METNNKTDAPMMKQIDAEKTAMYQNFANKRLLIALISVIIGFIIYARHSVMGVFLFLWKKVLFFLDL